MQTLFITGADRGIGLEFVKQYAAEGWRVLASYLGPKISEGLEGLTASNKNVSLHQLDVNDFTSVKALAHRLKSEQIDLLINNAGILNPNLFGSLDPQSIEHVMRTNAIAPLMVCEAFHPLLKQMDSVIVNISSKTASIGGDATEDMVAYRMSKAALNMGMQEVARKLAPKGIKVLLLAPGYVRTTMSPQGTLDPEESVRLMRNVISNHTGLSSGGFYDRFGKPIEW